MQLRLDSADFRASQYISQNLVKWAEETVLDSVKAHANAAGVPPAYLSALRIEQTGWISARVILDWQGPHGEPLGIWFEKGTKQHIIRATTARVLRWIDKKSGGKTRFAKAVKHPGTKALRIMELGAKSGVPRLWQKICVETSKFLEESKIP